jgi:lipocalin-like protein
MKRVSIWISCVAIGALTLIPQSARSQQRSLKDQIVGTWIYVSSTAKRDDGTLEQRPPLHGAVTYTADGHFHFISTVANAPKYASGVRERPTPEEAMATASTALAYMGTFTVDEATKTIHANIDVSTFPNFVGAPNQRRIVTSITADEMRFTNPRTPAGLTLEIVWKRAK